MSIGKTLLFAGGLAAGAGAMVAAGALQNGTDPQDAAFVEAEPTAQTRSSQSPFAVSSEESAELAEITEPASESPNSEIAVPDVALLVQRIELAESRIDELETALEEAQFQQNHSTNEFLPTGQQDEQQDTQTNLLEAGFEPAAVEEIQSIRNELQLQRLDLRDRATREGWISTDRYREERRELRNGSRLRETLGDDDFDKFLLAEGRDNRVRIESVIANSAAALAGLEVGDIVISYADERIFSFRELQRSTTEGERDQPVNIKVSRNGELIDLVIPRGPMGVTLAGITGTAE